jgi:GT2 family glycosyltransferase
LHRTLIVGLQRALSRDAALPLAAVAMSAVIPTYHRPELLRETLQSLGECEPPPDEVIVVDAGGSARDVVAEEATRFPEISFRYLEGPRGACRQRNLGMDAAGAQIILFADDDVLLEPHVVGLLQDALSAPGVVGATVRIVERSPRRLALKHSRLRRLLAGRGRQGTIDRAGYPNRLWDLDRDCFVESLNGCLMAVRADHARRLRFDEALEAPNGYAIVDDEEFSYRLSREGRLVYLAGGTAVHRNTGFSTADSREFNRSLVRNRHYVFRKNFRQTPAARAQWWLIMCLHVLHRAVNGDWRGVEGLVSGLREVLRGHASAP